MRNVKIDSALCNIECALALAVSSVEDITGNDVALYAMYNLRSEVDAMRELVDSTFPIGKAQTREATASDVALAS